MLLARTWMEVRQHRAPRSPGRHRASTPLHVQWFGYRTARDVVEDVALRAHDLIAEPLTGVAVAMTGVVAVLWALR